MRTFDVAKCNLHDCLYRKNYLVEWSPIIKDIVSDILTGKQEFRIDVCKTYVKWFYKTEMRTEILGVDSVVV